MGMSAEVKDEAEVTHVLEQLVELNERFVNIAESDKSVTELVGLIDKSSIKDSEALQVLASIEMMVNAYPEIYQDIKFKSHSFNDPKCDNGENIKVAAAFFEDANGDVYFAARGTGKERWVDNGTMMYEESSEMQRDTCDYFERVMASEYEGGAAVQGRLIVAGHSKGGNDTQYITLFSEYKDLVDLCISFDGPSFSDAAKIRFMEECARNGIDPDEYIQKIYGIVGENDYVFYRGRNLLMPEENIFFISTPEAHDIGAYHMVHFMSGGMKDENGNIIPGLNWQVDENGNIINGIQGPLGEMSKLIQEIEIEADDDVYKAMAMSIMTLVEKGRGGGIGAGDIKGVTQEQWRLFIEKGLPYLLEGLKERPDLLPGVMELLGLDLHGVDAEQAGIILDALTDIVAYADSALLAQAFESLLFDEEGNPVKEMLGISKIDWGLLFKSLPPDKLAALLQKHLPAVLKMLKDNPELLGFISESLGVSPSIALAFAEFVGDFASTLPPNVLADFLEACRDIIADWLSGKGLDLEKMQRLMQNSGYLLLAAMPASFIAASKQIVKLAIDGVAALAKAVVDGIKGLIKGSIEFMGDAIKCFLDNANDVIDAVLDVISGIANVEAQFLKDTLEAFKGCLPPVLKGYVYIVEDFIDTINDAIKQSAEMCKELLNSIKKGAKSLVGDLVGAISGAADAIGGFVEKMIGEAAETAKSLTDIAVGITSSIARAVGEIAGDARKYLGQAVAKTFETAKTAIGEVMEAIPWEHIRTWPDGYVAMTATWAFSSIGINAATATVGMATAFGALKTSNNIVSYDIDDLRTIQYHLKSIVNGWNSWFGMVGEVISMIDSVIAQSKKINVIATAVSARALAVSIDREQRIVLEEVKRLESGMVQTIKDYQDLEMSFV